MTLWYWTSYFPCSGRLALHADGWVICIDSKVSLLSWCFLTTQCLFILRVKHPSEDFVWIAVSCCFKSRFTPQELLRNWIRNIFLWRKASQSPRQARIWESEMDSSLQYQSLSHVFVQSHTKSCWVHITHTVSSVKSFKTPTWEFWRKYWVFPWMDYWIGPPCKGSGTQSVRAFTCKMFLNLKWLQRDQTRPERNTKRNKDMQNSCNKSHNDTHNNYEKGKTTKKRNKITTESCKAIT